MSFEETLNQSTAGENITDAIKKVLIINCAVNIPLAITSIIGNLLVLHAVWKTPTLRLPSMVLLCGLALSDLAVGAVVQPLFITNDFIRLYSQSERLKSLFMSVYNVFGFSLCGIFCPPTCFLWLMNPDVIRKWISFKKRNQWETPTQMVSRQPNKTYRWTRIKLIKQHHELSQKPWRFSMDHGG